MDRWISQRERALVWGWAVALAAISFVPVLDGYRRAPAGTEFAGFAGIYQNDYYSYLAWIRQAFDGSTMFRILFTTEPHGRWFFHPLFWAMGALARWTGSKPIHVWHLAQLAGCLALVPALYGFVARCTPDRSVRWIALLLATTASGVGWIWRRLFVVPDSLPFEARPIDLWMPEAQPFTALTTSFFTLTIALALMLVAFSRVIDVCERGRARDAVAGGVAALALAAIHPYDVVPLLAVAAAWLPTTPAAHRRALLWIFLMPLPYLVYGAAVAAFAAGFSQVRWSMPLPTPAALALGLGLPLVLAAAAVADPRVRREHPGWFRPAIWAAITAALLLAPAAVARKWIWGAFVPLAVLGAMGIVTWGRSLLARVRSRAVARRAGAAATVAVLAFAAVGSAEFYSRLLARNRAARLGDYFPPEYVDAMRWLADHAQPADVVLATPKIAPWLPGRTGVTVFAGHWAQTLDVERKQQFTLALFSDPSAVPADVLRRLLARNRVRYVVADAASVAAFGLDAREDRYAFRPLVHSVFVNGAARIWEVDDYRRVAANEPWPPGAAWDRP